MAMDQEVISYTLKDKAWALQQLMLRAPTANLTPTERGYVQRIEQWMHQVEPVLAQAPAGQDIERVPPLGVDSAELHELVSKIVVDQALTRRRRRQLAHLWPGAEHLHKQSKPLTLTSWLIAVGLVMLAALNVVDLVVLKDLSRPLVLIINLGAVAVVSGFWVLHHFGTLLPHIMDVEQRIVSVLAPHQSRP